MPQGTSTSSIVGDSGMKVCEGILWKLASHIHAITIIGVTVSPRFGAQMQRSTEESENIEAGSDM